jgi:hypothetical protein
MGGASAIEEAYSDWVVWYSICFSDRRAKFWTLRHGCFGIGYSVRTFLVWQVWLPIVPHDGTLPAPHVVRNRFVGDLRMLRALQRQFVILQM